MRKERKEKGRRKERESIMRKDQIGRHVCRLTNVKTGRMTKKEKKKERVGKLYVSIVPIVWYASLPFFCTL
jgi:hypothetical protein